jgi:hypothetical protein
MPQWILKYVPEAMVHCWDGANVYVGVPEHVESPV